MFAFGRIVANTNAMSIRQSEDWFHPTGLPMKIEIKGSGPANDQIEGPRSESERAA